MPSMYSSSFTTTSTEAVDVASNHSPLNSTSITIIEVGNEKLTLTEENIRILKFLIEKTKNDYPALKL